MDRCRYPGLTSISGSEDPRRSISMVDPMQSHFDSFPLTPEPRLCFDPSQGVFYADFSGCVVHHSSDVEQIRVSLVSQLVPLGRKVPAIVNYEDFTVMPDAWEAYVDMAREVAQAHYSSVSRYTKGAFLRAKLGRSFHQRGIPPHIFGSEHDARKFLCYARQSDATT
jgi:propionate CoA-transferase